MAKRQKLKGSAFERRVCKALSRSVSDGKRDDLFWRSAMSGGRATIGMKKGIVRATQAGDITAVDPAGAVITDTFVVECKDYAAFDWRGILYSQIPEIVHIWNKLCRQAQELEKLPLLVFKEKYKNPLMAISKEGLPHLGLMKGATATGALIAAPQILTPLYFCSLDGL